MIHANIPKGFSIVVNDPTSKGLHHKFIASKARGECNQVEGTNRKDRGANFNFLSGQSAAPGIQDLSLSFGMNDSRLSITCLTCLRDAKGNLSLITIVYY